MDTDKLPEARIEREQYVLAVFNYNSRTYYNTFTWVGHSKDATKYSTPQEALQAIEVYGQKYYNNAYQRPWEIWLLTESRTATWTVDSERQIL